MGDDYTIADISLLGRVRNLIGFFEAGELVGVRDVRNSPPCWNASWRGRRCSEV